MKKTKTSKRYRRSATAYRRLAWKNSTSEKQAEHFIRMAEKFERMAEREEARS